ncbi:MAG: flagellin, partial [Planctomycetes bacterium]|nr:flagellin [Planctomycetota bacterium]
MLNVNTNFPAMTGLRTLGMSQTKLNTSIERLSTGLRINRASDDPSGLVISEKLRSQINGLNMALTNTQNDINLVNTAEAALQEISDILTSMRSSVIFAMNTGFSIPEQIDAEQDKIDQSLVAIDRIAQSTRFSRRKLLDGSSSFVVEQNTADRAALDDLYVRQVRLAPSADRQTFSVNLTKLAERATLITNIDYRSSVGLASANPAGSGGTNQFVTLRVSGARGAEDVNFGIGSTVQDVISAINQNATSTGVYAS